MKIKPKNKALQLVEDLNYQVNWGSFDWVRAESLMKKAANLIVKLHKENEKLTLKDAKK